MARRKLFYLPHLIRGIAGAYRFFLNLKIIKWKTEIDSCRSSFRPSFPNRDITEPYQLLLNMKDRNWFMKELLFALPFLIWRLQDLTSSCSKWQELLWPFFSKLGDSRTLPSPAQNEMKKLVHEGASLPLSFLIGRLQNLISSCSKYFEILIWPQIVQRDYLLQKQKNIKNFAWVISSFNYLI